MKTVDQIVTELSGRRNKSCYKVLAWAIKVALSYAPEEPQMKLIESEVAKKLQMEHPRTVAKALSRAVEDIWEYGDRACLRKMYARKVLERPTPKELIYRIVENLKSGVEYRVYMDESTGEYGISGREAGTADFAMVYPCTRNRDKMVDLVTYLNNLQTPLHSFASCFLESGVVEPRLYSESQCFYDLRPNEIEVALEQIRLEIEKQKKEQ
ncbi:MAG: hypothetical protein IIY16_01090 [Oscillospiraceae bacterium]|nr:hypothetical protein [Oscillospiraceae bacterium]